MSVVIHLLPAGGETTARALTCAAVHLARHPDEWDRLRAARHNPKHVESFAAELLRYYPPIQVMTRIATAAAEVDGTPIARGDKLALSLCHRRTATRPASPTPTASTPRDGPTTPTGSSPPRPTSSRSAGESTTAPARAWPRPRSPPPCNGLPSGSSASSSSRTTNPTSTCSASLRRPSPSCSTLCDRNHGTGVRWRPRRGPVRGCPRRRARRPYDLSAVPYQWKDVEGTNEVGVRMFTSAPGRIA